MRLQNLPGFGYNNPMNIIPSSQAAKIQISPTATVWEFTFEDTSVSGAIAEIKDRYPEKGFAVNEVSKELAFIIAGEGFIVSPTQKHPISVGDLIFLDKGETYAWKTNSTLTLFMANVPKFDPKQHKINE